MKTLSQFVLQKGALLLLLMLIGVSSRAQLCVSSYPLINHSNCIVRYTYKIFDGSTCATTSFGSGAILPLSSININGIAIGVEDIELLVTYSPTLVTPPLNFGSGTLGGPWACYNNGAPATQSASAPGLACNVPSSAPAGWYLVQVGCSATDIW